MTRNECIKISCEIKEKKEYKGDLSGLLYSTVGMCKLSPDAGTLFAGYLLIDALTEANIQLNPFQQRRADIIFDMYAKKYGKMLEKFAKAQELVDYNQQMRALNKYCEEDDNDAY